MDAIREFIYSFNGYSLLFKEKSSADLLEKLETDIRAIEKFSLTTQEKQKRLVGNFLVISIGLYAVGFLIFYFAFFPPTWMERITYSVPLLIFPLIIFLLRRVLAWYYQRKINKNSTKLTTLRAEKKRILEEVMEKETYNVASKLLSKYGNKSYAIKSLTVATPQPNKQQPPESRIQNLNTSLVHSAPSGAGALKPYSQMPLHRSDVSINNNGQPFMPLTPRTSFNPNAASVLRHRMAGSQMALSPALQQPRPYPIINQQAQGILEKMVDYLIGDGPQNRYAMICKECFAHNGMARQEEFEYATFRCAFCSVLNPSRKSRPVAPKLPTTVISSPLNNRMIATNSSDDSTSDSSDDSDSPRRVEDVTAREVKSETPSPSADEGKDVNMNGDSVPSKETEKPSEPQSEPEEEPEEPIKNENIEELATIKESET